MCTFTLNSGFSFHPSIIRPFRLVRSSSFSLSQIQTPPLPVSTATVDFGRSSTLSCKLMSKMSSFPHTPGPIIHQPLLMHQLFLIFIPNSTPQQVPSFINRLIIKCSPYMFSLYQTSRYRHHHRSAPNFPPKPPMPRTPSFRTLSSLRFIRSRKHIPLDEITFNCFSPFSDKWTPLTSPQLSTMWFQLKVGPMVYFKGNTMGLPFCHH